MSGLITRRGVAAGLAASLALRVVPSLAGRRPLIEMFKDPGCDCCGAWGDIMRQAGFDVAVQEVDWDTLARFKSVSGVPEHLVACHTSRVEGYLIEGHVPVADIQRLLRDRPTALGLAVPGMPEGSPGMGPPSDGEGFDVLLFGPGSRVRVFATHPPA